jgi:hypothetical protein
MLARQLIHDKPSKNIMKKYEKAASAGFAPPVFLHDMLYKFCYCRQDILLGRRFHYEIARAGFNSPHYDFPRTASG